MGDTITHLARSDDPHGRDVRRVRSPGSRTLRQALAAIFISGALQFRRQFWQRGEQISHQAVIGDLEDGRFLILVDRHDHLAVLHSGEVLDGTGNPDSDIQFRRDDLSGLSDLELIGHEAGIDGRAETRRPRPRAYQQSVRSA